MRIKLNIIIVFIVNYFLITNIFPQDYGYWIIADSLNLPRRLHSSVVLPNGDVLVTGGLNGFDIDSCLSSCEIYDYEKDAWRFTTSMNVGRADHHSILLKDNRVLIIGGANISSCEIFDPITEIWKLADNLLKDRSGHTVSLLENGKVIAIGGVDLTETESIYLNHCEIYDPETNIWTVTDSMKFNRAGHTATLLNDGKLLVCGGSNNHNIGSILSICELYDPVTNTWSVVDSMNQKRKYHSATLLPDGRVLVSGGLYPTIPADTSVIISEVYDPSIDKWEAIFPECFTGLVHEGLLLNNGLILFTGGGSDSWELYDAFSLERLYHGYHLNIQSFPTNNLLKDGRVITIGGISEGESGIYVTDMCQIFVPSVNDLNDHIDLKIKSYILSQNYPNPFNPNTVISWQLAVGTNVDLSVYNLLGQKVTTLVSGWLPAGYHEVEFNGNNLSSGIYLYRIETGEWQDVKKMILMK
jgi:hypothetical protein